MQIGKRVAGAFWISPLFYCFSVLPSLVKIKTNGTYSDLASVILSGGDAGDVSCCTMMERQFILFSIALGKIPTTKGLPYKRSLEVSG